MTDRRPWLSAYLLCALALLLVGPVGCGLTRSTKAVKKDVPPAGQAEAPQRNWENYASDRNGVDYYLDKQGVTYPSKGLVRIWRKRSFAPRALQKEIIALDEIDCNEARYRSLEIQAVYWNGNIKTFTVTSPWNPIFTHTPDETVFLDFCKKPGKAE
ncbi:MAG: hypothetical protein ABSC19_03050 [Syntrophorhabdales bacterium]|jgi:hypothetical protein